MFSEIRKRFKKLLEQKTVLAPFVIDGMQAKMLERNGYAAGYITGFGIASTFGIPDLGLITQTEMVERISEIIWNTNIPFIADADTGYGNHLNVFRTVKAYERIGVAALHLEDQQWPKRCGYMNNKQVIEKEQAISKIKAAVDARYDDNLQIIARTDALKLNGWGDAEDRSFSFMEAGADMVFIDGISTIEDVAEYYRRLSDFPILLNNVPHFQINDLKKIGKFSIILHPGPMCWSWQVFENELLNLKEEGAVTKHDPFEVFEWALDVLGARYFGNLDNKYNQFLKI